MIRLLHTADLHLGWDHNAPLAYEAFERVLSKARDLDPDVFLVAGDLFDHSRLDRTFLRQVFTRLDRLQRPVLILPGNHDPFHERSVYTEELSEGLDHVQVFRESDGGLIRLEDLGLVVWGQPTVEHSPEFRPLQGLASTLQEQDLSSASHVIVVAHGAISEHLKNRINVSAPISLDEISQLNVDYLALGHQHLLKDVTHGETVAYYSGSPMGSGFSSELGYVLEVHLNGTGTTQVHKHHLGDVSLESL